ncbi:MAG TPA: SagB family peptide dehydrogenase [Pyrinomonadaceae bacterium]
MRRKSGEAEKAERPVKTKMTLAEFFARELPSLSDIVTFSNNLPMSLYADTTVVKSPEVVFRGLVLSRNRLVAEEYLLNFRRSESDLGVVIGANNYTLPMAVGALANRDMEEDEGDLIPLPPYRNVREPLGPVIRSRRSVRRHSGKAVSMQDLSTILYYAGGISGHLHVDNVQETAGLGKSDRVGVRTVMSGGGLYPIDLFVLALNVDGLKPGAYRYAPRHHALKPAGASEPPEVRDLAQFGEIAAERSGFMIGYVYNLFRNARKYGDAALAFALIETGAIAAHVHLLCTALGLGSCDVGSFSKGKFERLFDADGVSRHMVHLTVVGK